MKNKRTVSLLKPFLTQFLMLISKGKQILKRKQKQDVVK